MTEAERAKGLAEWYLGSMNDGLFIIDTPPRPSTDDIVQDRTDGPDLVINVTDLPIEKARAVVDAHNKSVRALRAYSTPVSTDAELRKAVAKAIDDISRVGYRYHYASDLELQNARECADAALSAIHASGWRIVPREPTEAMIEAACATAHDYSLGICQPGPSSWPDGYTLRERVDARSMMHLALRAALATTKER